MARLDRRNDASVQAWLRHDGQFATDRVTCTTLEDDAPRGRPRDDNSRRKVQNVRGNSSAVSLGVDSDSSLDGEDD
jgi:hypothetical protein